MTTLSNPSSTPAISNLCVLVTTLLFLVLGTAELAHADNHSLEGTIQIGALVPITGDGSGHGQEIRVTLDLAESEINEYLQEMGAGWELEIIVEDTATNPVMALEKLAAIKAHGVDLVVGPYSSAELRNITGYATSNDMMLISYSSIAPSLALAGDKIFRFIPDATTQAPVNARLFEAMGATHIIPIWRGDTWGDELVKATKERLELLGGTIHEGIRYNSEAVEFSTEASLLSDYVKELGSEVGRDNIGILLLTFSEGVNIAQAAYPYESLAGLDWVGSDTLLNVGGPDSDPISSKFFDSQITVTLFAPPENPVHDRVVAYVQKVVGREPIVYSLTAYEAAWAFGLALHASDSTDSDLVASALPGVLEERNGVFGKIMLNDAGDLATSIYEIWHLENNEWIHIGSYSSESDSISWIDATALMDKQESSSDVETGDDETSTMEGGGCLIATAAFGSELASQVQLLREIRDDTLLQTDAGSSFMDSFGAFYYSFSPAIADLERESPELRVLAKTLITPALYILGIMSVADPSSELSVIVFGVMTLLLLAGMYVVIPIIALYLTVRKIHRNSFSICNVDMPRHKP